MGRRKDRDRETEAEAETQRQSHRGIRHHLLLRNQRCLRHNGQRETQRQRDRGRDRDTNTIYTLKNAYNLNYICICYTLKTRVNV